VTKELNNRLAAVYSKAVETYLTTSAIPEGYAGPFVAAAPDNYEEARIRWMYVGQEGGYEEIASSRDVRAVMDEYAGFQGNEGPFWRFGFALERHLNPGLLQRSFIWSNIARVWKSDIDGRVPSEFLDFWSKQRFTEAEIRILRPQFVLFVTGPNYDDLLQEEFPEIVIPPLTPQTPVVTLSQEEPLMLKTYHPNGLHFQKLTAIAREQILAAVSERGLLNEALRPAPGHGH